MRNRRRYVRSVPASASIAAVLALLPGCRTVVEGDAYPLVALGDPKALVLEKLAARPTIASVEPAVVRPAGARSRTRPEGPDVVTLAETPLHVESLPPGEVQYLLAYDVWHFEDSDGGWSVVLSFSNDRLDRVTSRRDASWWESLR